ncbi:MAG: DUF4296 domain-containing protein [Paraprevotella sp.]|nr:DUF4296 domain-containing protein [Paraprevotella sp.]
MKSVLKFIRRICLAGGSVFCLYSCKPGVPSELIQPSELEDILYDYHIAQAMADASPDSMNFRRYSYVEAVFAKYGVTKAEFDSTMVWYSAHATYLNDIYTHLRDRYSATVSALGGATGENDIYANLSAQGDTANIWHERTFRMLKSRFAEDRLLFTMAADTTFHRGDAMLWRFDPRYIFHGQVNEAYAGFYVEYDNDSTAGVTRRVYSNSQVQLRLEGDTAHNIREVGGFVYYKRSGEDGGLCLLSLQNIMLIRFHRQPEKKDTVAAASPADSLKEIPADSARKLVPVDSNSGPRLSPSQLRDSRPVERSIHVVKEKPYRIVRPARGSRGYGGRSRR